MLIGEAPGQREDDLEKPFQGPAGQLLDKCMAKIGMDRTQVFIDNVVRCRPPKNRKPEPEEVAACRQYLVNVIRIVKPRVVVAMGATALYGTTGKTGISKWRGQKIYSLKLGVIVLATWHPSYCLRTRSAIPELEEDLELATRMLGLFDFFGDLRKVNLRGRLRQDEP
jgi:DNA polymerase